MPHYKDGTPAQIGDAVRGKGYNLPDEFTGIVVNIKPGQEACNVTVLTVRNHGELSKLGAVDAFLYGSNSDYRAVGSLPQLLELVFEYGQADQFEKLG